MRPECLLVMKKFTPEDEFEKLKQASEAGDIKTEQFITETVLDRFDEAHRQLVRDVGIEAGFMELAATKMANDTRLSAMTKEFDALPADGSASAKAKLREDIAALGEDASPRQKELLQKKLDAMPEDLDPKAMAKVSKQKAKLRKKMDKRKADLANEHLNALWDDSGFTERAGTTSTYKEDLAVYQTLVSRMSKAANINPDAYGRTVRLMTENNKLDLIRAVWGKQTPTKGASEIATAFYDAQSYGIQRLQRAGSKVNPLDQPRLTNTYDPAKLTEMGRQQFIDDHIDPSKFILKDNPDLKIDKEAGGYLPSENPTRFYGEMWDNITNGYGEHIPEIAIKQDIKTKLANRESPFRYVNAVTGDDWYSSATKYGRTNDPLEAMNHSLQGMAHQITMLEKWGSNPSNMWKNYLNAWRSKTNSGVGNHADNMFQNMTTVHINSTDRTIRFLQGARDFEAQHLLGSASLAAVSDIAFQTNEAIFNGLSPLKVVMRHMKGLVAKGDLHTAQEMGVIANEVLQVAGADHRLADTGGNGILRRSVNFMVKASGLNRWTNAGKSAFGLEFLKETAKVIRTGKMNKKLAAAFERYGISQDELMSLQGNIVKRKGVEFLNPAAMDLNTAETSKRVLAMTIELTHSAVPEPGLSVRTRTTMGTVRGQRGHEVLKTATQFMSFPMTVAVRTYQRALDRSVPLGSRIGHLAGMMIGGTMLGSIIVQAKGIVKGEGLHDMNSPEFWSRAAMQGGGWGYITDFALSTHPLFGPPTIRRADRMRKFMQSNMTKDVFERDAEDWYNELVPPVLRTAEEATGFVTNLWWTKLAVERVAFDAINNIIDPSRQDRIKNTKKYLRQTNPGSESWWEPGENKPNFMQK